MYIVLIYFRIKVQYGYVWADHHGGHLGGHSVFYLRNGEKITRIYGRTGLLVDQLTFYTNHGRRFGPYGGHGGGQSIDIDNSSGLKYISGKSAALVDGISFHFC